MELKDVVSVTGMPGLHKILGRNKSGLILESLVDQKKFSTNPRQRISILSDIAMFTDEGEVKLAQVLTNIKGLEDGGTAIPDAKSSNDEISAFMGKVLPTFDRERVYVSDMRKLFTWYGFLKNSELDFANLLNESDDSDDASTDSDAPKAEAKTAKKATAAPKNTAPKKPATGAKTKTTTPRKMGS